MTSALPSRAPRAFELDDPGLVAPLQPSAPAETASPADRAKPPEDGHGPISLDLAAGIRWGQMLASAAFGLALLAAGVWFARFVSVVLERNDVIGWTAWVLLSLMALAVTVLALREIVGLLRLSRLGDIRRDAAAAIAQTDKVLERGTVERLGRLFTDRAELRWGRSRLQDHMGDVLAPGDLMRLAERELVVPLDVEARRLILQSAKRVSTVTAISPMAWIGMLFVLIENLRLMRTLAALYGGRPGLIGGLRLARMIVTHIIATGGIALTDDLLGQFLGQDLLRRLSRRLGEGVFNGALTARIGVAAVEVTRPLPFVEATPLRVRDIVGELFRRQKGERSGPEARV